MTSLEVSLCPRFQHVVEKLGRRWSGAVVRLMLDGATRFGELSAAIPGISDKMLSERLKELEAEGIVIREVKPTTPVSVEYHLTAKGESVRPVLDAIGEWARVWVDDAVLENRPA